MTNIYARTIGAVAEAYGAFARMATIMMFAGLETTRATTNYVRQNAKGVSRITSNTARVFAQTAKETVEVQDEEQRGVITSTGGGSISRFGEGGAGSAASHFEQRGGPDRTTTTTATDTIDKEGTEGSSGETGSTTTTTTTTTTTRTGTATEAATAATDIGERQEKSSNEMRKK